MEDESEDFSDTNLHENINITRDEINRDILHKLKENDPSLEYIEVGGYINGDSRYKYQYYLWSRLELHALTNALATNLSLKRLSFGHGDEEWHEEFDIEGARALADALRTNHTLKELYLNSTEIGTGGARALAKSLRTNHTLENLDLSYNGIGTEGARALAKSLRTNQSLKILNLDSTEIGTEGARALADALRTNHTLESLNLDYNDIGTEGARALADTLRNNCTLKEINLSENRIGNEGAHALGNALRINCTLETLHLCQNQMGNEGALAFAGALVNNSSLKDLHLDGQSAEDENDDITNETWTKFSEVLCHVSSINATHCSNHTLQDMGYDLPEKLNSYLRLNSAKSTITLVRMEKIFKHHRYFDMKAFFGQGWEMLPYVFDWLEKARSHASSDHAPDVRTERGSVNTIAVKEERIMNEKLNAIHQFARAMPDIFDREAQMGARLKRKYNMV